LFGFKRKKRCFHDWTMIDYENFVDSSLGVTEYIVLGCKECSETKSVDPIEYRMMQKVGLIK